MKKKFTGALATPLSLRHQGLLANKAQITEIANANTQEVASKLSLLCQHYGIPEGAQKYLNLSLALAREFVPGFQERKKRGRTLKWTTLNKGVLIVEIERQIERGGTGHSEAWAANQLANREPWKSFIERKELGETDPNPGEVLRKVYQDFKEDKWADVSRDAFKWHQHNNTVHKWDAKVTAFVRKPHPK